MTFASLDDFRPVAHRRRDREPELLRRFQRGEKADCENGEADERRLRITLSNAYSSGFSSPSSVGINSATVGWMCTVCWSVV